MKLYRTVHCAERPTPWIRSLFLGLENSTTGEVWREGMERAQYGVAEDPLSSATFVSMVQATYLRNRNDTTLLRSIHGSRLRRVFRQR